MKLYIIRHGETVWNTEGRLQGKADIELNENGIRLARVTAEAMRDIPFNLAITSPLKRARQTAELIVGDRKIPVIEDERIEEITFGVWEGLCCKKDNFQIPSTDFQDFFADPFHYQPPEGGETIPQLLERTGAFYQELIHNQEYQNKTILIASHGCSSRALLYHVEHPGDDFWRGHVPANCAVSIVDVQAGRSRLEELDKIYYNPEDVIDFYGT